MEKSELPDKRSNGIYYTPEDLAKFLVSRLLTKSTRTVLDPAYGNGALLLAAEAHYREFNSKSEKLDLFGCDIHPDKKRVLHIPKKNLKKIDFFKLPLPNKYDLIFTNPPYIRHHNQNGNLIKRYKESLKEINFLSNTADLWAYFLIKSTLHLKSNGSIGAILPWSFIQADYSQKIRGWLLDKFKHIELLALNNDYFESAQERIVILWLKEYGNQCNSIKVAFNKDFNSSFKFSSITEKDWTAQKLISIKSRTVDTIFQKLTKDYGFDTFEKYAICRIGIVTGANKYFIAGLNEVKKYGFKTDHLIPIITSSKELPEYIANGKENLKNLIVLNETNAIKFEDFIKKGISQGFDKRAHSRLRHPWYSINPGVIPEAFFPYRISRIPYMVLNHENIQCLNSVHRIYFKNLSRVETCWLHVSILSVYSQLSLAIHAKTYGRGMMKIEPGGLNKISVYVSSDPSVTPIYQKVVDLLKMNQKDKAVQIATKFINMKLKIDDKLFQLTFKSLEKITNDRNR